MRDCYVQDPSRIEMLDLLLIPKLDIIHVGKFLYSCRFHRILMKACDADNDYMDQNSHFKL